MNELVETIHLLSLEPNLSGDQVILRLEHLLEKDDDYQLSKPVTLDLSQLFLFSNVTNIEERSLSTVWPKDEMKRWEWKSETNHKPKPRIQKTNNGTSITIHPQQIKTFILHLN